MKKIIITLALAAVAALSANAQIGVGIGYGTKNFNDSDNDLGGLFVGASYNIPLASGLAVAPGIDFAMYSYKGDNVTVKENYLAVPVLFNYAIEVADGFKLVPFAGPTLSYGLSSKTTLSAGGVSVETNNYGDNSKYTQFDILIGGGVALDVMDMIRVHVGYNAGLLDRNSNDNATTKATGINFGVAYLF